MEWFLGLDLFNKLFLIFVIFFCIAWMIDTFGVRWYKNNHPKFRKNNNEFIEYYSLYYNCWRIFYIWNDKKEYRILHMHDTIRELEYDVKYIGNGRSAMKYDKHNIDFLRYKFKKTNEIDDDQNILINKEDTYLKENILNH